MRVKDGKLARGILAFQPVFAMPVFVSVLAGTPPLWVAGIIALIPLVVRFWLTRRFLPRTPFDVPILLLAVGLVVGLAVAADKDVAISALATTLASALIYCGMVENGHLADRYWVIAGGIVCAIALVLVLLFFSEAPPRVVPYNAWVFPLFQGLPKTGWPVLGFNSIGVLLSVLLPPLAAIALFQGRAALRIGAAALGGHSLPRRSLPRLPSEHEREGDLPPPWCRRIPCSSESFHPLPKVSARYRRQDSSAQLVSGTEHEPAVT